MHVGCNHLFGSPFRPRVPLDCPTSLAEHQQVGDCIGHWLAIALYPWQYLSFAILTDQEISQSCLRHRLGQCRSQSDQIAETHRESRRFPPRYGRGLEWRLRITIRKGTFLMIEYGKPLSPMVMAPKTTFSAELGFEPISTLFSLSLVKYQLLVWSLMIILGNFSDDDITNMSRYILSMGYRFLQLRHTAGLLAEAQPRIWRWCHL